MKKCLELRTSANAIPKMDAQTNDSAHICSAIAAPPRRYGRVR
jgi:hypothetical protein